MKSIKTILLSTLSALGLVFSFAYAQIPAGSTVDPSCGPTDPNCYPTINTIYPVGTTTGLAGQLKFLDLAKAYSAGFRAADTLTSNVLWTLPTATGTAGQVLALADNNGTLIWAAGGNAGIASGTASGTMLIWNGNGWGYTQGIAMLSPGVLTSNSINSSTSVFTNSSATNLTVSGDTNVANATATNIFVNTLRAISAVLSSLGFDTAIGGSLTAGSITATSSANLATTTIGTLTVNGTTTLTNVATGTASDTLITRDPVTGELRQISYSQVSVASSSFASSTMIGAVVQNATQTGIFFLDASGKLAQDTANFNYDAVSKKLTITGGVDPLFMQLKDVTTGTGAGAYIESYNGRLAATSAPLTGRLIYNASTSQFQVSLNGSDYTDVIVSGSQATLASILVTGTSTLASTTATFLNVSGKTLLGTVASGTASDTVLLVRDQTTGEVKQTLLSNLIASTTNTVSFASDTNILSTWVNGVLATASLAVLGTTSIRSLNVTGDTTLANATSSNLFASIFKAVTSYLGELFFNNATGSSLVAGNINATNTLTAATSTLGNTGVNGTLSVSGTSTLATTTVTDLTANNLNINGLTTGNITAGNINATNTLTSATATLATTTISNLTASTGTVSELNTVNASSSNLFASIFKALTSYFGDLFFNNATGSSLVAGTINATSSATLSSTTIVSTLNVNGTSTLATTTVSTINVGGVTILGTVATTTAATNTWLVTRDSTGEVNRVTVSDLFSTFPAGSVSYSTSTRDLTVTINGVATTTSLAVLGSTTVAELISGSTTVSTLTATGQTVLTTASATALTTGQLYAASSTIGDLSVTGDTSLANATSSNLWATILRAASAIFSTITGDSILGNRLAVGTTSTSSALVTFQANSTSTPVLLTKDVNGNDVLVVNGSGTVAIAGTADLSTTTFNGDVRINYAFRDSLNNSGSSGQYLTSTGTSTKWVSIASTQGGTATGSTLAWTGSAWAEVNNFLLETSTTTINSSRVIVSGLSYLASTTVAGWLNVAGDLNASSSLTVDGTTKLATTTATNLTATDLSFTNASGSNATATNLFAEVFRALTSIFSGLLFDNATGSSLVAGNINATNTLTAATSTLGNTTVNGQLSVNGTTSLNGYRLIALGAPINTNDATNKAYVDALVNGLSWKNPVIARATTSAPGSPTAGARYILATSTATGFGACVFPNIAEWDGSAWVCETVATSTTANVSGEGVSYTFNGTAWVSLGSSIQHNSLIGLQGGDGVDYYHLGATDYLNIATSTAQLRQLLTSGSPTFVGITAATSSIGTMSFTNSSGTNSTTTNLFAEVFRALSSFFSGLLFDNATGSSLVAGNITATSSLAVNGTSTLATTTISQLSVAGLTYLTTVASGTASDTVVLVREQATGAIKQMDLSSILTTTNVVGYSATSSTLTTVVNGVISTTSLATLGTTSIAELTAGSTTLSTLLVTGGTVLGTTSVTNLTQTGIFNFATGTIASATLLSANILNLNLSGTTTVSGSIIPSIDSTYDLGSFDKQWKSLFVSSTTIYVAGTGLSNTNGTLSWAGSAFNAPTSTLQALTVNGTAAISGNTSINGNTNINGNTSITGLVTLASTTAAVLTVSGKTVLGTVASGTASDTVVLVRDQATGEVKQTLLASLIPSASNTLSFNTATGIITSQVNGIVATASLATLGTTTIAELISGSTTLGSLTVNGNTSLQSATSTNFFAEIFRSLYSSFVTIVGDSILGNRLAVGTTSTSSALVTFQANSTSTPVLLTKDVNGNDVLVVNGSGTVAIAGTLTTSQVTANGDVTLNYGLRDSTGATGTVGQYLMTTGTSTKWAQLSIPASIASGTATGTTLAWNGTSWAEIFNIINTSTSTTIGSTTAFVTLSTTTLATTTIADLTVTGTTTLASTTVTAFTATGGANLQAATSTNFFADIVRAVTANLASIFGNTLSLGTTSTSSMLTVQGASTTVLGLFKDEAGQDVLAINGNGSIVAIRGTTSLSTTTISGDLVVNYGLVDSLGNRGSAGQMLVTTGTSTRWTSVGTVGTSTATGSILVWNGAGWVESQNVFVSTNTTRFGTTSTSSPTFVVLSTSTLATTSVNGTLYVAATTTLDGAVALTGTTTVAKAIVLNNQSAIYSTNTNALYAYGNEVYFGSNRLLTANGTFEGALDFAFSTTPAGSAAVGSVGTLLWNNVSANIQHTGPTTGFFTLNPGRSYMVEAKMVWDSGSSAGNNEKFTLITEAGVAVVQGGFGVGVGTSTVYTGAATYSQTESDLIQVLITPTSTPIRVGLQRSTNNQANQIVSNKSYFKVQQLAVAGTAVAAGNTSTSSGLQGQLQFNVGGTMAASDLIRVSTDTILGTHALIVGSSTVYADDIGGSIFSERGITLGDNAPTTTARTLYASGSDLYWSGTRLQFASTSDTILDYFYGRVGSDSSSGASTVATAGTTGVNGPTNYPGVSGATTNYYYTLNAASIQTNMGHTANTNGEVILAPGRTYRIAARLSNSSGANHWGIGTETGRWLAYGYQYTSGSYINDIDTIFTPTTTTRIRLVVLNNYAAYNDGYLQVTQLSVAGSALAAGNASTTSGVQGVLQFNIGGKLSAIETIRVATKTLDGTQALIVGSSTVTDAQIGGSIFTQAGITFGNTPTPTTTANTLYASGTELYWSGARFQIASTTDTVLDYHFLANVNGYTFSGSNDAMRWTANGSEGNMGVNYSLGTVVLAPGRTYELEANLGGTNSSTDLRYAWYYSVNNGSTWVAIGRSGDSAYNENDGTGYYVTPANAIITPTTTTLVSVRDLSSSGVFIYPTNPTCGNSTVRCGAYATVKQIPVAGTALAAGNASTTSGQSGQLQFNFGGKLASTDFIRVATDTINGRMSLIVGSSTLAAGDVGGSIFTQDGLTFGAGVPTTTANTLYASGTELYWSGARFQIASTSDTDLDFFYTTYGKTNSWSSAPVIGPMSVSFVNASGGFTTWGNAYTPGILTPPSNIRTGNMSFNTATGEVFLAPGRTYEITFSPYGGASAAVGIAAGNLLLSPDALFGTGSGANQYNPDNITIVYTPTTTTAVRPVILSSSWSSYLYSNSSFSVKQLPVVGTAKAAGNASTTSGVSGQLQFNVGGKLAATDFIRVATDTINGSNVLVLGSSTKTISGVGGNLYLETGLSFGNAVPTTTANTLYASGTELYWSGARFQIASTSDTELDYMFLGTDGTVAYPANGNTRWTANRSQGNMMVDYSGTTVVLAPGRTYELDGMGRENTGTSKEFRWAYSTNGGSTWVFIGSVGGHDWDGTDGQMNNEAARAIFTATTTTLVALRNNDGNTGTLMATDDNSSTDGRFGAYAVIKQIPVSGTIKSAGNASTTSGVTGQLQFNFGGKLAASDFIRVATDTISGANVLILGSSTKTISGVGGNIYLETGLSFGTVAPTTTANTLYASGSDLYWAGVRFQLASTSDTVLDYLYARVPGNCSSAATVCTFTSVDYSNLTHTVNTNGEIYLAGGRVYEIEASLDLSGTGASETYQWQNAVTGASLGNKGVSTSVTNASSVAGKDIAKAIVAPTSTMRVRLMRLTANGNTTLDSFTNNSYVVVRQLSVAGTVLAAGNASTTSGQTGQLQFNFGGKLSATDMIRVSTDTISGTQALIVGSSTISAGDIGGSIYSQNGITFGAAAPTTTANTLYAVGSELYWSGTRFMLATSSDVVVDYMYLGKATNQVLTSAVNEVISWSQASSTGNLLAEWNNGTVLLAGGRTYELDANLAIAAASYVNFRWQVSTDGGSSWSYVGTQGNNDVPSAAGTNSPSPARAIYTASVGTLARVVSTQASTQVIQRTEGDPANGRGGSYAVIRQVAVSGTALAAGNSSTTSGTLGQLQFNFGGKLASSDMIRVATKTVDGIQALVVGSTTVTDDQIGGSIFSENGITFGSAAPTTTANTLYASGTELYWSGARFQLASTSDTELDYVYLSKTSSQSMSTLNQLITFQSVTGNLVVDNSQVILAPGRTYELEGRITSGTATVFPYSWYYSQNGGSTWVAFGDQGNAYGSSLAWGFDARGVITPTTTILVTLRSVGTISTTIYNTPGGGAYAGSYAIVKQLPVVGTAKSAGNASTTAGVTGQMQFNYGGKLAASDMIRVATKTIDGTQALVVGSSTIGDAAIGGSIYSDRGITFGSAAPTTTANTLYASGTELFWSGTRFQLATSSDTVLDYLMVRPSYGAGSNGTTLVGGAVTVASVNGGRSQSGFAVGNTVYPHRYSGVTTQGNMAYDSATGYVFLAPGRTYRLNADLRTSVSGVYFSFISTNRESIGETYDGTAYDSYQTQTLLSAVITPTTTIGVSLAMSTASGQSMSGGSYWSVEQLPVVGTAQAAGNASATNGLSGQLQFNFGGKLAATDLIRVATDTINGRMSLIIGSSTLAAGSVGGSIYSQDGITLGNGAPTTTANTLYASGTELYWSGARFQIASTSDTELDYMFSSSLNNNQNGYTSVSGQIADFDNPTGNLSHAGNGAYLLAPGRTYEMTAKLAGATQSSNAYYRWVYGPSSTGPWTNIPETTTGNSITGGASATESPNTETYAVFRPTTTVWVGVLTSSAISTYYSEATNFPTSYAIIKQLPVSGTSKAAGNSSTTSGVTGQLQFNFGGELASTDFIRVATDTINGRMSLIVGSSTVNAGTIGGSIFVQDGITLGDGVPTTTARTLYAQGNDLYFGGARFQIASTSDTNLDHILIRPGIGGGSSQTTSIGSAVTVNSSLSPANNTTGSTVYPQRFTTPYYVGNMSYASTSGYVFLSPGRTYRIMLDIKSNNSGMYYGLITTNRDVIADSWDQTASDVYTTQAPIMAIITPTTTIGVSFMTSNNATFSVGGASYFSVEQLPVSGTSKAAGNQSTTTGVTGQLQFNLGGNLAATDFIRVATDTINSRMSLIVGSTTVQAENIGGSIFAQDGITLGNGVPTTTAQTLYASGTELYWSGARFQIASTSDTNLDYIFIRPAVGGGTNQTTSIGAGVTVNASLSPTSQSGTVYPQRFTTPYYTGNMSYASTSGYVFLSPGRTYRIMLDIKSNNSGMYYGLITTNRDVIADSWDQTASDVYTTQAPIMAIITPTTTIGVSFMTSNNATFSVGGASYFSVEQLPVSGTSKAAGNQSTTTGVTGQLQFNLGGNLAATDLIRVATDTINGRMSLIIGSTTVQAENIGGSIYSQDGITLGNGVPTTTAQTLYASGTELYWSGARFQIASTSDTLLDYFYADTAAGAPATSNTAGTFTWTARNTNMAHTVSVNGEVILAPGRTYEIEAGTSFYPTNSYEYFEIQNAVTGVLLQNTVGARQFTAAYSTGQAPQGIARGVVTPTTTTRIRINRTTANGATTVTNGGNVAYFVVKQLPVTGTAKAAGNASTTAGVQGQLQFNFGGTLASTDFIRVATDTINGRMSLIVGSTTAQAANVGGSIFTQDGLTFGNAVPTTTANTLYASGTELYWSGARFQIASTSDTELDYMFSSSLNNNSNSYSSVAGQIADFDNPTGNLSHAGNGAYLLAPGRTYEMTAKLAGSAQTSNAYYRWVYGPSSTGPWTDIPETTNGNSISGGAGATESPNTETYAVFKPTTTVWVGVYTGSAISTYMSQTNSYPTSYAIIKQLPVAGTAAAAGNSSTTAGMYGQLQFNFGGKMASTDYIRVATDTINGRMSLIIGSTTAVAADIGGSIFTQDGITFGKSGIPTTTANTLYASGTELYWSGARFQIASTSDTMLDYFYGRPLGSPANAGYAATVSATNGVSNATYYNDLSGNYTSMYTLLWRAEAGSNMSHTASTTGEVILAPGRVYEISAYTQATGDGYMAIVDSTSGLDRMISQAIYSPTTININGYWREQTVIVNPTTTMKVKVKNGGSTSILTQSYFTIKQLPVSGTAKAAGNSSTTSGVTGQLQFNFGGELAATDFIRVATDTINGRMSLIVGSTTVAAGSIGGSIYSQDGITFGAGVPTTTANTLYASGTELYWSGARFQIASTSDTNLDYFFARTNYTGGTSVSSVVGLSLTVNSHYKGTDYTGGGGANLGDIVYPHRLEAGHYYNGNMSYNPSTGFIILAPGRTYRLFADMKTSDQNYAGFITTGGMVLAEGYSGVANTYSSQIIEAIVTPTTTLSVTYWRSNSGAVSLNGGASWSVTQLPVAGSAKSAGTSNGELQFAGSNNTMMSIATIRVSSTTGQMMIGTSTATGTRLTVQGVAGDLGLLSVFATSGANVLTVNSNGNIGIGTSTPNSLLTIAGSSGQDNAVLRLVNSASAPSIWTVWNDTGAGALNFQNNGVTKMVIASSTGNVGIGTTSPISNFTVVGSGTNTVPTMQLDINASGGTGLVITSPQFNFGATSHYIAFQNRANSGSIIGSIANNNNTGISYNQTSDRRLKENFASSSYGLANLLEISVEDYNFISDTGKSKQTGFIAQNLAKVFPNAVTKNGDDGEVALGATSTPWQIDYSRVTPLIVKAVQELNAKSFSVSAVNLSTSSLQVMMASSTLSLETKTGEIARRVESVTQNIFGTTTEGLTALSSTTLARTASSTEADAKYFASSTLGKLITNFLGWAGNGIEKIVANTLEARRIVTETLCIGNTCINETDLKGMLQGGDATSNTNNSTNSSTDSESNSNTQSSGNSDSGAFGEIVDNVSTSTPETSTSTNSSNTSENSSNTGNEDENSSDVTTQDSTTDTSTSNTDEQSSQSTETTPSNTGSGDSSTQTDTETTTETTQSNP